MAEVLVPVVEVLPVEAVVFPLVEVFVVLPVVLVVPFVLSVVLLFALLLLFLLSFLLEISPRIWGVYCVDRVEMCGQILLDIQRKVESVYEVKGKI